MAEALFPTRWKNDKPPSIEQFMERFHDDYACAEYLAQKRWPEGFVCPHCGSKRGWRLESKPWVWECAGKGRDTSCRRQTSVIAGTIMHGTHLPLRTWFIAAYLVATHSNGISALQLQPKIGVGSYKTAWLLLHKLRRAMVDPDRTPLDGDVEIDETSIAYRTSDDPVTGGQGKSPIGKIFIIGAVERRGGRKSGRIRLAKIREDNGASIRPFVLANTAAGCAMHTDANNSYLGIPDRQHLPKNLSAKNALPAHIPFERIHRVFSNLKRLGMGVYHGFRVKHIDAYLHEFEFRWNRRRTFETAMDTLLDVGQALKPVTSREIVGDTTAWRKTRKAMLDRLAWNAKGRRSAEPTSRTSVGPHKLPMSVQKRRVLPPRRPGEERDTRVYLRITA